MKKLLYIIAACIVFAACEKNEAPPLDQASVTKRPLSDSELILKTNLDQAARIVADISQDEAVLKEIALLASNDREFWSLAFSDLFDETKGPGNSFSNLRQRFLGECSSETKGTEVDNLVRYLSKNGCYLYCPYPVSFYPKGTMTFTVAAHPVDNDIENTGYRYDGRRLVEVKVNEDYADRNMVLLVMPRDEGREDIKGHDEATADNLKGDPVYEVRVGRIRCADFCGGLFEGDLDLRIARGYPEYNLQTDELKGKFSAVIPISYPRAYARAAIKDWTIHSEGGWFNVNVVWDSNWETTDTKECILVYEYDRVKEISIGGTVGFKKDPFSASLTATAKTKYSGDFLGLNEWNRDWFFATNKNPGPGDELKDGWTVRKTSSVFQLTTPSRTIGY